MMDAYMKILLTRAGAAILCWGIGVGSLGAQDGQAPCIDARRALDGSAIPAASDVLVMRDCPRSAAPALAKLWARPEALPEATVDALEVASRSLRDPQLSAEIERQAAAGGRSTDVRLAAMAVLLSYFDPQLVLSRKDLWPLARKKDRWISLPQMVHTSPHAPMAPAARQHIVTVIAGMAANDQDSTVQGVAHSVLQALAFKEPQFIPVAPDAVTLRSECVYLESEVILESRTDIAMPMRVHVLGTTFDRVMPVSAHASGKPGRVILGLPSGTVIVTLAGRELARLDARDRRCPPGRSQEDADRLPRS